ncbi:Pectin lyase fold/virulence factor [Pseudocohnilembus persalinus]|uniref:Pectin lyase fold/virulence factor n=1 Tax=Pseudocohnilembus persalinus TaxID=266149 RepID=A0A0V0QTG5_PSEPJ|nr:Pectin lyase fold/virulence factor [Pseudocohnilembus persalinus]|eukprot:KRX05550.1 Pectin lyase fold/virulence factor [Pseudocohnilembus persalinus]
MLKQIRSFFQSKNSIGLKKKNDDFCQEIEQVQQKDQKIEKLVEKCIIWEEKECQICFEDFQRNKEFQAEYGDKTRCYCSMCNDCQSKLFIKKIDDVVFDLENPKMLCVSCKKLIKLEDFYEKLQFDQDKTNQEIINEKLMYKFAKKQKDIVFCPKKGCKYIGKDSQNLNQQNEDYNYELVQLYKEDEEIDKSLIQEKKMCVICYEDFNRNEEFQAKYGNKTRCYCSICNDCQTQLFIKQVQKQDFDLQNPKFLCLNCKKKINLNDFFEKLWWDQDKANKESLNEELFQNFAKNQNDIVFCPKMNCKYIGYRDNQNQNCFECELCQEQYKLQTGIQKKNKNEKISNSLDCVVCLKEFKRNEEYLPIYKQKTKCGCPVCNECQTQWMLQKIDQIDFDINNAQLQCCQCKQNIQIEQFYEKLMMDKNLNDNFCQRNDQNNENCKNNNDAINTNYIDMINEKLTRKYAQQDQEMVMCPKEGCKFIGFKEKQWWRQKSCFECEICEKQYPLFINSSIKGFKLKEFLTWAYKIIKCQKCPNCKSFIQKNGGCNNMHCSQCKKNFCWQCGQKIIQKIGRMDPKKIHNLTGQQLKQTQPIKVVDAESGPYFTIQNAIDEAEENTVIQIAPGLYSENIIIKKNGLILEARDKVGDIIMVVENKPAIIVELQEGQKCTIKGMKLSHSGNTEDVEKLANIMEKKQKAINLFGNINEGSEFQSPTTPENELINKFPIDQEMNCILLVQGGGIVHLEECLLSLNFIVNNYKNILPAIVIDKGCTFSMNRVEITGNKHHETIGVIVKQANCSISESKIHRHLMGGILVWALPKNNVKILNSKVIFNKKVGIHVIGNDSNPLIEGNKIEHNQGSGIKIGIANKTLIARNEIKLNQIGVEVVSGEPTIIINKIDKNFEDGVFTYTHKNFRCDAKIITNLSIAGNKENGVFCKGMNNFTVVQNNYFIGYNKKAGVKVDLNAHIYINKNRITKNMGQGILFVETSSGTVEQNEITENIKANIALGGANSQNTVIVENNISGGRCEGIFIIEGANAWIIRNNINENNDGIVCIKSAPEILTNKIIKNKSNGVMLLDNSQPLIRDNLITDNDGIGLFIRSKCRGQIEKNIIISNEIELAIEKKIAIQEKILKNNQITGDKRLPQQLVCNIF